MIAALAAVSLSAMHSPARAAGYPAPSQLGGLWQLDPKQSETLQQKMEERRRAGGGPGFRGGGGPRGGMGGGPMGGMGGRRGGGFGGHGPEDEESGEGRGPGRNPEMRELAQPPMSLVIEPGDGTFVLSERGRTLQVLVLEGAELAGAAIQPDAPHLAAKWRGARLVTEREGARGGRITREFELDDKGEKLTIRTRLEGRGGRPPLDLKRVYLRSAGDEESPPPPATPAAPDSTR